MYNMKLCDFNNSIGEFNVSEFKIFKIVPCYIGCRYKGGDACAHTHAYNLLHATVICLEIVLHFPVAVLMFDHY